MDVCARGLKAAAHLLENGELDAMVKDRYDSWSRPEAVAMLDSDLASIAARVEAENINPAPRSGRQEILENLINRFV